MACVRAFTAEFFVLLSIRIISTFAFARLGSRGGDTRKHCARCHLGVGGVTLPLTIADRVVGSIDLDNPIAPIGQEACESGTV